MTETGALSPADVMAMTNSEGLGGNNAFFWIFALLLLGGMGNGGFYGGGYKPQYATQGDVQNSFNFSDLQDQNRDILNAVNSGTAQSVAALLLKLLTFVRWSKAFLETRMNVAVQRRC